MQLLTTKGKIESGPMKGQDGAGLELATCTLWAPACTVDIFKQTYLPAVQSKAVQHFSMYALNDKIEQDDHCARIYNKSLLYLVSNAFEARQRIPLLRDGVPILGMERSVRRDPDLEQFFASGLADLVLAPNNQPDDSLFASKAAHHGDFDEDPLTVRSTFNGYWGPSLQGPTAASSTKNCWYSRVPQRD